MRIVFAIISILTTFTASTQTLGGNAAYNFTKLPASPLMTATGGINISYQTNDVGYCIYNPALLDRRINNQLATSFNSFLAGIKAYSLSGGKYLDKQDLAVAGQVYFVDYGSIPQTDASGNVSGSFRPIDYVAQLSASKKYLQNWAYGASIKYISSSYQQYKSNAVAVDVGILYYDSSSLITAGLIARNMGFQLSTYAGEKEDLPFDLEVGITKKLANAPFGFSLTAHHIHQFNLNYDDADYSQGNSLDKSNTTFDKLFNHLVFASHIYLGNNLEATVGYNHLRRSELNVGSSGNGLNGFSAGIRIKFQKLQVLYSRAAYQQNVAFNQFGLNLQLDQLTGIGN